ncbi:MAG: GNAT family acetyltransferase [Chloroflexi bacterium]|nr:GNAT family acetyltransferase [Chloroflexota bacterium]MCY3938411.1 GNAT family acetyltransferase [Chloroflexota bacterium]
MEIRSYEESDQEAVVNLWRECGLVTPWNDPVKDIGRKLRVQRDMFLVGSLGARLVATVMAGYEGHRGWINYLAVAADCRNRGFGRRLMQEAEGRLRAMGCPKINLQVRTSNTDVVKFYRAVGYSVDDVVSMGKRLEEDEGPAAESDAGS